jgi:uncharacterized membrane protein
MMTACDVSRRYAPQQRDVLAALFADVSIEIDTHCALTMNTLVILATLLQVAGRGGSRFF